MAIQAIAYWSWREIWGDLPTDEEVRISLQRMERESTVILLCRLAIHLFLDSYNAGQRRPTDLQRFLAKGFLDARTLVTAARKLRNYSWDSRRPFHLQQILTVLKWAIIDCGESTGAHPDTDEEARYELGRCLLKTNDLLVAASTRKELRKSKKGTSPWDLLGVQLVAGAGYEINNPPHPLSVARSEMIFGECLPRVVAEIDLAAEFQNTTGLTLGEYVDMTMGVLSHYLSKTHQQLLQDSGLALLNPKTYFGQQLAQQAQRYWERESISLQDVAARLSTASELLPHQDFILLRERPFLRISNGNVVCTNPGFVLEKLEAGLFWAIFNSVPNSKRQGTLNSWGKAFEEYVVQTLERAIRKDLESFSARPAFLAKKMQHESFDAMVTKDGECAVIECKGGFLNAKAKYAEDRAAFIEDLDKKFGCSKRAGIEQLVRKIGQVFSKDPAKRRTIEGLDPERIQTIYPVLVVQEFYASSIFVTPWLAKQFACEIRKQRLMNGVVCAGLIIIHVQEMEMLQPYLKAGDMGFVEILRFRARKGDPGEGRRVFNFGDILQDFGENNRLPTREPKELQERLRRVFDRVCFRFFGRSFEVLKESRG